VSFDIFFQGFRGGESVPGGGDRMRAVLEPYASQQESPSNFWLVQVGDGTADVYLDDDNMMANHVSGRDPWELLFKGAQAAGWVIMPVGCPTCLTHEGQLRELPEELQEPVVAVNSGADLVAVVEAS
jgi:hypothetical protein